MIDKFEGEYRFLSNFYDSPILYDKMVYPTVEHAYQAAKFTGNPERQRAIMEAPTAAAAKKFGRLKGLRPDWDEAKLSIMRELIALKFEYKDLREKLLATGNEVLVEGNWWNDTFWGVCKGKGENWLGKILMEERDGRDSD